MCELRFACPKCFSKHDIKLSKVSSDNTRCKGGETYYSFFCPNPSCNYRKGWFGSESSANPFTSLRALDLQQQIRVEIEGLSARLNAAKLINSEGYCFY